MPHGTAYFGARVQIIRLPKLLGSRFQLSKLQQFLNNIFHYAATFFDVSHFAATKNYGHLDFVLVLQETLGLFTLSRYHVHRSWDAKRISFVLPWWHVLGHASSCSFRTVFA